MLLINQFSADKCIDNFKIATLGPEATSSEYASTMLSNWFNNGSIVELYSSYEEAFESVKSGISDVIVVANAYQDINSFYMDNDIELLATFIQNTPKYGIAVRKPFDTNSISVYDKVIIASHPAPVKKIDYYKNNLFYNKRIDIKLMKSTSEAAKNVRDGEYDFCLTNAEAVKTYDLKFISSLTDISMVWSILEKQK